LKGYVETPSKIADLMIDKLFKTEPFPESTILDPGCGTGVFIDAIIRWCQRKKTTIPQIVGIDYNPRHASKTRFKFREYSSVSVSHDDFLKPTTAKYDFVVGNPPYVPITDLSEKEKGEYRALYQTAVGRFDLYLLFFECALRSLRPGGRLVFITPEKFLYVETASPLRKLLQTTCVEEIQMMNENVFGKLVTYPTISTITNRPGPCQSLLVKRNGESSRVMFPSDGSSWLPYLVDRQEVRSEHVLEDICLRISCGVATGADSVFVLSSERLSSDLKPFAYATIGGRELGQSNKIVTVRSMLIPYDTEGRLLDPERLGPLWSYLSEPDIRGRLEERTCVSHKPWYAFHENPPLRDILRPKIICKDIAHEPHFWIDRIGTIVPRHSTYYIVPNDPSRIDELADFLNSREACDWLETHCQRAANGFLRIQSHMLKQLPIPGRLSKTLITVSC
jgi:adenine-specific DNA-methyltransferase